MKFKDNALVEHVSLNNLSNGSGLTFTIHENGSIHNIRQDSVQINLFAGSPLQAGCSNIYLRIRGEQIIAIPLMGPGSSSEHFYDENFFGVKGCVHGISYMCRLLLAEQSPCWCWQIQLNNIVSRPVEVDLVYVQDVGLIPAENGEYNEFYVSQYIDYTALDSQRYGRVVCCRQNEHVPGQIPWLALGSKGYIESFLTDGQQFFGTQYRSTGIPQGLSLGSFPGISQKEVAVVALQEKPFSLSPQESRQCSFFGIYCDNHKLQTSQADLDFIDLHLDRLNAVDINTCSQDCFHSNAKVPQSLFSETALLSGDDLNENELTGLFGTERRHCEWLGGELLSFFYGEDKHVVLKRKELVAKRPHGHILKSGSSLLPQESTVSSTAYMFGVFHSHVCQGNVNFNRFLTVNKNPFNLSRHTGQRIFIELDGEYCQLAVPSAFEMELNRCRWIYKHNELIFEIIAEADTDSSELVLKLHIIQGKQQRWLISNELDSGPQWVLSQSYAQLEGKVLAQYAPSYQSQLAQLYPEGYFKIQLDNPEYIKQIGGDELLFSDSKSRGLSFAVIKVDQTNEFELRLSGCLVPSVVTPFSMMQHIDHDISKQFSVWQRMDSRPRVYLPPEVKSCDMDEIMEILPWFAQDAKIHYLTPHGLEQYGGAAWGTRDICQGPLEMLLSLGYYEEAKEVLCKIFSNQNVDGNWPQWWMFDRYRKVRSSEAHGDVILWPILALSEYLIASGDYAFLEETLPFYSDSSKFFNIFDHILRCFEHIDKIRFSNGCSLINYSEGDWNDAMQPTNPKLKERLISSWTVTLSFQAFKQFAAVCRMSGREGLADTIQLRCDSIKADFNKHLIKDDVVAGFGYLNDWQTMDLLLHPSDMSTGIQYRLLPMIRGIISEIFSPQQAHHHVKLIEQYLKGPDGARLMDRPPRYHGGLKQFFKRAESSPFFGREVGLMYTHAHLRYAEALAKLGHAEAFVRALRQIIPIRIQDIIPQASIRQSNCYYSSSDADFADRYEVDERYDDIRSGKVTFDGGWRIYSSGPGIAVRLIIAHLFGIRHAFGKTVFDPVLPPRFDGMTVQMEFYGYPVMLEYKIAKGGQGVSRVIINDCELMFLREDNPYRMGGAMIEDDKIRSVLKARGNRIQVFL